MENNVSDPTGTAGTALGATSLILQLFQGCVQGFSLWQRGEGLASDALVFRARLDMQASKLAAWGVDWGFDRGPDAAYLTDKRFVENGDLAVRYLVIIHSFLGELRNLSGEFPSLASAENVPVSAATSIGDMLRPAFEDSDERKEWAKKIQRMKDDAQVPEKLKWALREGEINKTLELLVSMIDELCQYFNPPKEDPVALHVLNSFLSSINIQSLNAVVAEADEGSMLQNLAVLKLKVLELQFGTRSSEAVANIKLRESPGVLDERKKRSLGTLRKVSNSTSVLVFPGTPRQGPDYTNVLVEWKFVDGTRAPPGHSSSTYRAMTEHRIKNLARLLKAATRLPDMRTLGCLGIAVRDGATDDEVEYGMVFSVPAVNYRTLKSILDGPHDRVLLDDWFTIAHSFTRAVLCLHLAGWLHKGIRSENILYFANSNGDFSYAEPYLAGFEYTRQITAQGQTESVTDDLEANLYRHPEVQGPPLEPEDAGSQPQRPGYTPFNVKHDLFGVGMVLLELGTRRSAMQIYEEAIHCQEYGKHSAAAFRTWIVDKELHKLGGTMGKDYQNAATLCIKSEFQSDEPEVIQPSFYKDVVRVIRTFGRSQGR
ncbi:prion-inhibition and propagation-domain-containing protein [Podospora aff. communis PSN243]|uniref:Prion-inhibition and propagation-domain-containing protein n=1 Tax=Podospora aff. communis PSN243 TaxID=3040156 RepID=A0AAV9G4P2_9PEZI|nr:prion-inhibition and propagation-domain-containing protein [Podospora aff. communis PSN243]